MYTRQRITTIDFPAIFPRKRNLVEEGGGGRERERERGKKMVVISNGNYRSDKSRQAV